MARRVKTLLERIKKNIALPEMKILPGQLAFFFVLTLVPIIALVLFLVSYLAFYLSLKNHLKNLNNPFYQAQRMEKAFEKQVRDFDKFNEKYLNNPFEPKMRPMIVNLVKEPQEYKVIVDLSALDGNEESINITINNDELTSFSLIIFSALNPPYPTKNSSGYLNFSIAIFICSSDKLVKSPSEFPTIIKSPAIIS